MQNPAEIKLTSNVGNAIDDVIKHWTKEGNCVKYITTTKRTLNSYIDVNQECTFAWNVKHRSVLPSVVTEHSLVNTLIFPGELNKYQQAVYCATLETFRTLNSWNAIVIILHLIMATFWWIFVPEGEGERKLQTWRWGESLEQSLHPLCTSGKHFPSSH